jgi:hypothetical protein
VATAAAIPSGGRGIPGWTTRSDSFTGGQP